MRYRALWTITAIYKKSKPMIIRERIIGNPICSRVILSPICLGKLATILAIKMTIEPPIPKKEFKSDSQTKKKVPAIRRIVFVRIANPLGIPTSIGRLRDTAKDWMRAMAKVKYILRRSCISIGSLLKPDFLENENICQIIMADIQGDKPTEKSENELKLPPIIALVKAIELDNPPKSLGCFKSINGKTKWLPKT